MFGTLGEIVFSAVAGPDSMESMQRWEYAEHRVVEGTPSIQWIGNGLTTLTLGMLFHRTFTNPAVQLAALVAAASDHQARALVFSNGTHQGYFVITAIRTLQKHMSDMGDPICVRVNVELKQWALGTELNPSAAPIPSFLPIGVVPAAAGNVTSPLSYAAPASGGSAANYLAPLIAAAGVSSILSNPALPGASSAEVIADDIPTSTITRSPV